jgi:hypothetical protein
MSIVLTGRETKYCRLLGFHWSLLLLFLIVIRPIYGASLELILVVVVLGSG